MSDEPTPSSLTESMKRIIGNTKTRHTEQVPQDSEFAANHQLIREREKHISQLLQKESSNEPEQNADHNSFASKKARIKELVDLDEAPLTVREKGLLLQSVLDSTFGFGPITQLMRDAKVTRICVNGPSSVWIQRTGQYEKAQVMFENRAHIKETIDKVLQSTGQSLNEESPMVSTTLANGTTIEAVMPPASVDGPSFTIYLPSLRVLHFDTMVRTGALSEPMAELLTNYVKAKVNIVVCGPSGSGKTALLEALCAHFDPRDRIITIEERTELRMTNEHWLRLRPVSQNINDNSEISMRALIKKAKRMSPSRLIVSECRGAEGFEFLDAMYSGSSGNITTVTAINPRDCLVRFENMIRLANPNMPSNSAREMIANTIQVIVQTQRGHDNEICVSEITELEGIVDGRLMTSALYSLESRKNSQSGESELRHVEYQRKSRFLQDSTESSW